MTAEGRPVHGTLWWVSIFVVLLFLPWALLLGWMGLAPIFSMLLGAAEPENLGVRYSAVDLQQFEAKTGVVFSPAPPATPLPAPPAAPPAADPDAGATRPILPTAKPLDLTLTQEELSAVLNKVGAGWLPLRNVQVRLGAGSAEVSGALDTSRIGDFMKSLGVRDEKIEKFQLGAGWALALGDNVPVYAKLTGGVQDSLLNMQVDSLRLGNFEIPQAQLQQWTQGGVSSPIKGNERFSIQQLTLQDGGVKFVGTLPPNLGRPAP